jgi:hypothetical protein
MARIPFSDPAWKTTFPFLVEPRANEWLVGLLLHCDEANHWGSGTTLTHLCRKNEKTANSDWTFIAPSGFPFDDLADALAVPYEALVATTRPGQNWLASMAWLTPTLCCSRPRSPFASVQCVWQSNVCSLAHWSCHIALSVHSTRSCWSPPAFVGQRYALFTSKLRLFDASSVAWTGQNCPRNRLTRDVSRSKRKCSRTTSSSGRMGRQTSWRALCDSSMTAWWKKEKSAPLFPIIFPGPNLQANPTGGHPRWVISFTCCGSSI